MKRPISLRRHLKRLGLRLLRGWWYARHLSVAIPLILAFGVMAIGETLSAWQLKRYYRRIEADREARNRFLRDDDKLY